MESTPVRHHDAWNKGKLVGQKAPFKLKEIRSIRVHLEMQGRLRELALFDLGIDSKLRACDLLSLRVRDYLFPSRVHHSPHLGTRQYARIVDGWVKEIGLDPTTYGTHSMRRTKPTLIYRRTKNLRAQEPSLDDHVGAQKNRLGRTRYCCPPKNPELRGRNRTRG